MRLPGILGHWASAGPSLPQSAGAKGPRGHAKNVPSTSAANQGNGRVGKLSRPSELRMEAQKRQRLNELMCAAELSTP